MLLEYAEASNRRRAVSDSSEWGAMLSLFTIARWRVMCAFTSAMCRSACGKMVLQLSAIHRSKGSGQSKTPSGGESGGVLALGTRKGLNFPFPRADPMLAYYRPPVGSIPDSGTSNVRADRSRSAPCLICALG